MGIVHYLRDAGLTEQRHYILWTLTRYQLSFGGGSREEEQWGEKRGGGERGANELKCCTLLLNKQMA